MDMAGWERLGRWLTSLWEAAGELYPAWLGIVVLGLLLPSNFLGMDYISWVVTHSLGFLVFKLIAQLTDNTPAQQQGMGSPAAKRAKKTRKGIVATMEWCSVEMQGWRLTMEDATATVASLPDPLRKQALFAVFDGHGGSQVSRIVSVEFPKVLAACARDLTDAAEGKVTAADAAREAMEAASSSEAKEAQQQQADPDKPKEQAAAAADDEPGDLGSDEGGAATEEPLQAKSDTAEAASDEAKAASDEAKAASDEANAVSDKTEEDIVSERVGKALHLAMMRMDADLRVTGKTHQPVGRRASRPVMSADGKTTEKQNAFARTGSTAIVLLVDIGGLGGRPRRLTVANCGDSRAVLCRNGKAVELSQDHKPELPGEEQRIRWAGGFVALVGLCHRIDGWGLNLSRALGDFYYKSRADLPPEKQKVSCVPDIRFMELTDEDEFLILGCDGIFELNSSQEAVALVRQSLGEGASLVKAAERLVDKSCSEDLQATRGMGGDNCSAIVVKLK